MKEKAWAIMHRRSKYIETDTGSGQYEIYNNRPKYANTKDFKTVRVILVTNAKLNVQESEGGI